MRKKNYQIIILAFIFLGICVFLLCYFNLSKLSSPPPNPPLVKGEEKGGSQIIYSTLEVGGGKYQAEISEGTTVYDFMVNLQKQDNNFSFKGKNYPALGFFVDEINGVKGGSEKYWIYYINGQKAEVGISNYKLKNGDIISWKQE